MSTVLKKSVADKTAFKFQPKSFHPPTSDSAKDFVKRQESHVNDFQVAEIVANQTGISELNKKMVEAQVEETVLLRLKEMEEQAYKQGHDLGLIEGTEKAFEEKREEFGQRLATLDHLTKDLETTMEHIYKVSEGRLVDLVFKLAQKIAMREIDMRQEPIVDLVTRLVTEIQSTENVLVKLNPSDQKFIDELRQRKVKEAEPLQRVKVHSDENIRRGGCIVETNFGAIDATIEQRVEKAWSILQSKLPVAGKEETDT